MYLNEIMTLYALPWKSPLDFDLFASFASFSVPEPKPKEEREEVLPTAVGNFDEAAYLAGQVSLLGGSTEKPNIQSCEFIHSASLTSDYHNNNLP